MTNWRIKFNMSGLIRNDEITAIEKGKKIAKMIKGNGCFDWINPKIAKFFDSYDPDDDYEFAIFDNHIAELYDFADNNNIWLSSGKDI